MNNIRSYRHIYFIGIGGIGMSALARFFLHRGTKVSGYDLTETVLTQELVELGANIHYQIDVSQIPEDIDFVIYTPAVPDQHEEYQHLLASDLPVIKRSKALGMLSESMQCIAVAGTHGKTSCSSMIAHIMTDAGLKPHCFIGGIMKNYGTNYIDGDSDWFVTEADEYDRSFLQLFPTIAVIQSLDADHLDIYGSHEQMIASYEQFTYQIKEGGSLILQEGLQDKFPSGWAAKLEAKKVNIVEIKQAMDDQPNSSESLVTFTERVKKQNFYFDLSWDSVHLSNIISHLPGVHNIMNGSAAIIASLIAKVAPDSIAPAMDRFEGIKRRFEWVYKSEEFVLIDDYAHHPEEVKVAIETARKLYPKSQIGAIFQPHLYSRTQDFHVEFAKELDKLDLVLLLPIYPAREEPIPGVSSKMILDIMKNNNGYLIGFQDIIANLHLNMPKVLMTLGASDIDKFHKEIVSGLRKQRWQDQEKNKPSI